jgi:DNA-directed RNA polymerase subunit beta' (EC 2.7.7.6)
MQESKYRINGKIIETTTGRVMFNNILPEEVDYINEVLRKRKLVEIIGKFTTVEI